MKTLLLFAAAALAVQPVFLQTQDLLNTAFLPQQAISKVPSILRLQSDVSPDGTFTYTFDTENGISAHAEGTLTRTADPEESIQTIRGQYSYTGPDGVQYTVQYIADHNGYQAFGEHLPTPPPIPDAILRSLEHNAAHPEEDDGIVSASPALAPTTGSILGALSPRAATPLQPIVAAPLTFANPTAAPPTRSPVVQIPKPQQQLAQNQLLAQTQVLQQQQLQGQQPFQITVQPQQLQPQQLQPQQLQPQQFQQQQLQPQQLQPQQLQLTQLQPQQLQAQQLQLQARQQQQLQPQDFITQFAPSFQTFESQRRNTLSNV